MSLYCLKTSRFATKETKLTWPLPLLTPAWILINHSLYWGSDVLKSLYWFYLIQGEFSQSVYTDLQESSLLPFLHVNWFWAPFRNINLWSTGFLFSALVSVLCLSPAVCRVTVCPSDHRWGAPGHQRHLPPRPRGCMSAVVFSGSSQPSHDNYLHLRSILFFPYDVCFSFLDVVPSGTLLINSFDAFFWSNTFQKTLLSRSLLCNTFLPLLGTVLPQTPLRLCFSHSFVNGVLPDCIWCLSKNAGGTTSIPLRVC